MFSEPLGKAIAKCLTAPDGCKYVLFNDGTAIRVFNPPDEPGTVTLCNHAATYLNQQQCAVLYEAGENLTETPIINI